MMDIADAMPENKFSYKSTPAQRNYAEQIMHVAQVNVGLLKVIGGKAAAPTFTAQSAKTKAELLKALGDSYDYGIALIKEQSEATMLETPLLERNLVGLSTIASSPSTRFRTFRPAEASCSTAEVNQCLLVSMNSCPCNPVLSSSQPLPSAVFSMRFKRFFRTHSVSRSH